MLPEEQICDTDAHVATTKHYRSEGAMIFAQSAFGKMMDKMTWVQTSFEADQMADSVWHKLDKTTAR
jgi:hypothetical protein